MVTYFSRNGAFHSHPNFMFSIVPHKYFSDLCLDLFFSEQLYVFFHLFTYSYNKYLLSTYVLGPVLSAENSAVNKTDKPSCPNGVHILEGK